MKNIKNFYSWPEFSPITICFGLLLSANDLSIVRFEDNIDFYFYPVDKNINLSNKNQSVNVNNRLMNIRTTQQILLMGSNSLYQPYSCIKWICTETVECSTHTDILNATYCLYICLLLFAMTLWTFLIYKVLYKWLWTAKNKTNFNL